MITYFGAILVVICNSVTSYNLISKKDLLFGAFEDMIYPFDVKIFAPKSVFLQV